MFNLVNRHPHTSEGAKIIQHARDAALRYFSADDKYILIFTAGATSAYQLLLSTLSLDWFLYTSDAHASVRGAHLNKANTAVLTPFKNKGNLALAVQVVSQEKNTPWSGVRFHANNTHILVTYPMANNFDGYRHTQNLCTLPLYVSNNYDGSSEGPYYLPQGSFRVCADAAHYAASELLDLSDGDEPDFVVLSFYKMFPNITGLGALLVKKTAVDDLQQVRDFAGGTVQVWSPFTTEFALKDSLYEQLERGTQNFGAIYALVHTLSRPKKPLCTLAKLLIEKMKSLRYPNGNRGVTILSIASQEHVSNTIAFVPHFVDGGVIPPIYFTQFLGLKGIDCRGGCFCNAGSCQLSLYVSTKDILIHIREGKACDSGTGLDKAFLNPRAACRLCISPQTDVTAIEKFLTVVEYEALPFFTRVSSAPLSICGIPSMYRSPSIFKFPSNIIESLWIYPIKSGPGICLTAWPLTEDSLLWDRIFKLDLMGNPVDRRSRLMQSIRPTILFVIDDNHQLTDIYLIVFGPPNTIPLLLPMPDLDKYFSFFKSKAEAYRFAVLTSLRFYRCCRGGICCDTTCLCFTERYIRIADLKSKESVSVQALTRKWLRDNMPFYYHYGVGDSHDNHCCRGDDDVKPKGVAILTPQQLKLQLNNNRLQQVNNNLPIDWMRALNCPGSIKQSKKRMARRGDLLLLTKFELERVEKVTNYSNISVERFRPNIVTNSKLEDLIPPGHICVWDSTGRQVGRFKLTELCERCSAINVSETGVDKLLTVLKSSVSVESRVGCLANIEYGGSVLRRGDGLSRSS